MNGTLPSEPWLYRVLVRRDDVYRVGAGQRGHMLIDQFADQMALAHVLAKMIRPEHNADDGDQQHRGNRRPSRGVPHTVVANDKTFKSKVLDTGEKFTFTATKPGTYPYLWSIHPKMTGTLTVE